VTKVSTTEGRGTKAKRRNVVYLCRILREELRGWWHDAGKMLWYAQKLLFGRE
jgi:hypothetical protein